MEPPSSLPPLPAPWVEAITRFPEASFGLILFLAITCAALAVYARGMKRRIAAARQTTDALPPSREAIFRSIHAQQLGAALAKPDRDMLGGLLALRRMEVGEAMVHRQHLFTIDADLPVAEVACLAAESGHSRLPLWQEDPDNIIGILHIRDLFKAIQNKGGLHLSHDELFALLNKPWYIPESTSLQDQLAAFRAMRQHFALVVDEYGVLQGIITLEDILEEIVGEIDDEHDLPDSGEIVSAADGSYHVEGHVTLRELNRQLDWQLPDADANTIAGLLIHEAQLIPQTGQKFTFHNCHFTVLSRSGNRITRLQLKKMPEQHSVRHEAQLYG